MMVKLFKNMLKKLHFFKNTPVEVQERISFQSYEKLLYFSAETIEESLKTFKTSFQGVSEEEVEERLETNGTNEVANQKPLPWYLQFLDAFLNPFIGVLFTLGLISIITDIVFETPENRSWKTVIVITLMIFISACLRFWQEFKSIDAAEQLKAMVRTTATVKRKENSHPVEIPLFQLVPGDIISLSAGDMVPADVKILSSKDLFISQAFFTGEALPVEKQERFVPSSSLEKGGSNKNLSIYELSNICFMGTNVVSGTATALVIATGRKTYLGSMARQLTGQRFQTSFDRGVKQVSWILVKFMAFIVPTVFFINGFTKHNWLDALFFSLSVAVGLTPGMLPMIVTTNLAKGAITMSRRKTIVKHLNAIQNFGSMNILCTDKTGTLTQNKIVLVLYLDSKGEKDNKAVLEYAYLNSYYQTGLKNLLDLAVIDYAQDHPLELSKHYQKIDELPFDFARRCMSVILKDPEDNCLLICKGAAEEVMDRCSFVEQGGQTYPLTPEIQQEALSLVQRLGEEGLRVLAVAYKKMPPMDRSYTNEDESAMTLSGYIAFLDPPKESAEEAIKRLQAYGVDIKIITGDAEAVAQKICKEVGLEVKKVVTGSMIEGLTDAELSNLAEETTLFAKISPLLKARIIQALQSKKHTVGFLGDGINDAAALKQADVGISVDTAVDIAKESADIILLEKSLLVLEEGVIEGRKTFANIIKYIKMTASSNFGNVFSVLIASAFLPFLPMLPIHLLIQNLLYDLSQMSIPWDHVDKEFLQTPRQWKAKDIARFMIFIGPVSSIFDIMIFVVMWTVFKANHPEVQSLFQSGWFVVGLSTQLMIVYMIRTEKVPFLQSNASFSVIALTSLVMMVGIYVPYSVLGESVGLVPLPTSYFYWLIGIVVSYCALIQLIKRWYIKRYGEWL
jgi:Mg2+-importing ATPase